jgi:hypothetical protein
MDFFSEPGQRPAICQIICFTLSNFAQTARCLLGILQVSLSKEETMAKQAADHHREAAEHHEKARTMPTSRMATANGRSIRGLTRRSPMSNIMRIGSGAMKDGAYCC